MLWGIWNIIITHSFCCYRSANGFNISEVKEILAESVIIGNIENIFHLFIPKSIRTKKQEEMQLALVR